MAYSLDFRQRVMRIKKERKLTFEKTSEHFGIGIRTLFRWQERLEPKMKRNKPATKINMNTLKQDIHTHPDAYLFERADRFKVSITGMFYALRRIGITNKKNPHSSQN